MVSMIWKPLKNYSDLFKIYNENKNFVNHGDSEKWFEIIRNLPNLHTDYPRCF